MTTGLYKLGRFLARHKFIVILVWAAILAGVITWSVRLDSSLQDDYTLPGTQSQQAEDALEEFFPTAAGTSATIVFQAESGEITDPAKQQYVGQVLQTVFALDDVVAVSNPYNEVNGQTPNISQDGSTALATVNYSQDTQITTEVTDTLTDTVESTAAQGQQVGVEATAGGNAYFITANLGQDDRASEILGITAAVIILLIAFGSIVALGLPLISAFSGLALGIPIIFIVANWLQVSTIGPTVATMIGLGVGIDYALFIVRRFREYLHEGLDPVEAAGRAIGTAGQAVIVAGLTVIIALLGLLLIDIPVMSSIAYAAAITVGSAIIIANTLLPALLALFGRSIERLNVHHVFNREGFDESMARAWGQKIVQYPRRFIAGALVILIVLIIPIFSLQLGAPGEDTIPADNPQRIVYDIITDEFGVGYNGPLLMVSELPSSQSPQQNQASLVAIEQAVAQTSGVAGVAPATVNSDGTAAVWATIPTTSPSDPATEDLINNLRDNVIPQATGDSGVTTFVGGLTAEFVDMTQKISDRMPVFMVSVIGLAFILLLIVFRSLFVPFVAAIMIALTASATFGVMVAVFQWGWLQEIIGLSSTGPLVSYVPIMVFAIIFGLSMDYEIFLMSRVRENYLERRRNKEAVVHGLAKTARIIIAAALIMFSVFVSFNTQTNAVIKMFGTGLAVAIIIDVFLARMVLVPAITSLGRKTTWWLPKALRWIPDLRFEDSSVFEDSKSTKTKRK